MFDTVGVAERFEEMVRAHRAELAAVPLADRIAGMAPGPELLELLLALAEQHPLTGRAAVTGVRSEAAAAADPPGGLDGELAVRVLQGWDRLGCWLAAHAQAALVAVAGPAPASDEDWPALEIAAALRLAASTAHSRIETARALTGRLAATRVALAEGRFPIWYASHLAEQLADRTDPVAAAVQAAVLPKAGSQTFGQFRRAVGKALAAADPRTLEQRHAAAAADRRVLHWDAGDGMGQLLVDAPITSTADFYDALSSYAYRRIDGDTRSLDQRRADVLDELTSWLRAAPGFPTVQGRRRELGVLIDWDTLRGLDDQPGELNAYGPVGRR